MLDTLNLAWFREHIAALLWAFLESQKFQKTGWMTHKLSNARTNLGLSQLFSYFWTCSMNMHFTSTSSGYILLNPCQSWSNINLTPHKVRYWPPHVLLTKLFDRPQKVMKTTTDTWLISWLLAAWICSQTSAMKGSRTSGLDSVTQRNGTRYLIALVDR